MAKALCIDSQATNEKDYAALPAVHDIIRFIITATIGTRNAHVGLDYVAFHCSRYMLRDRTKLRVNERQMWIKRSINPFLGVFLGLSIHGELFAALGSKVQKRGSALQE